MKMMFAAACLLLLAPASHALALDATNSASPTHASPSHGHNAFDPLSFIIPPEQTGIRPERHAGEWPNKLTLGKEADAEFGVKFVCPTFGSSGVTGQEVIMTEICPSILRDDHDIMSQPLLMVEPTNPTCFAFHAMHGGRGVQAPTTPQPPSTVSRDNGLHQPHTVWRTCNDWEWADNPYYAPESVAIDGRAVFGEDNAATQDKDGNMYIAGILSYQGPADPSMQYLVYMHRLNRVNQEPGYNDPYIVDAEPGATMHGLQLAYIKKTGQVAMSWVETTRDTSGEPLYQVRTQYSNSGRSGTWEEVGFSDRIGGCAEISEMVPYEHVLYVACRPGNGYFAGGNYTPSNVQIHEFDTLSWTSRHVAQTPLTAGHIKMVDADNGWQMLMASGADPNGRPFAQVTYGALGDRWENPRDYASEFMRATRTEAQGQPLLDARITAAVHDDTNGLVYMVWALKYDIDPTNPTTLGVNSLAKSFVVIRGYQGGFMASLDLNYGVLSRATAPAASYQGGTEDIFWDNHESIIRWRDARGGPDRIFMVMGDYGTARFGEVVPQNPPNPILFPPAAVPAIPLAAAAGTTSALSVALAAAMGLMLLRLLAAKKKVKVETPTI